MIVSIFGLNNCHIEPLSLLLEVRMIYRPKINETSVNKFVSEEVASIDDVILLDAKVRKFSCSLIDSSAVINKKGNV